jgi:CPA2 family monovalent cation:H+ antiporter-2
MVGDGAWVHGLAAVMMAEVYLTSRKRPLSALSLVLLLLGASVLAAVICRRFNLPPVLGYLLVGSVIGPHALNLMSDMHRAGTWPNSASSS